MMRTVLAFTLVLSVALAARIPGSPYPVPSAGLNSSKLIYVIDDTQIDPDNQLLAASLQGILSRQSPMVYRTLGNSSAYFYWITAIEAQYGVEFSWAWQNAPLGLVRLLRPDLAGYVLTELNDTNSVSASLTAAALLDAVVATPETASGLSLLGYKMLYDLRGQDVLWVLQTLNGTAASNYSIISNTVSTLQDPAKFAFLSDWSIFARSASWWSTDMSDQLSTRMWTALSHGNASVFGWGYSEVTCVSAATRAGSWVHASDWAKNIDVYSSFDVSSFTQLPRIPSTPSASPPSAVLAPSSSRKTSTPTFPASMFTPPTASEKVHTVALLMTDGDNLQWLVSDFFTDSNFWASPDRGLVPLGWTMAAVTADLAPPILSALYQTAARPNATIGTMGSDIFIAAASGVGYAYPDIMSAASQKSFAQFTGAYMAKADMQHLNVLGLTYTLQAATALLSQPTVNSLLWYDYASYSALNGNVTWIDGPTSHSLEDTVKKPVIGGRFQLWDGVFDNVTTLAAKLLSQKRDASSVSGYSLIPVHVWSNNVTSAVQLVQALAAGAPDGSVRVIAPDEFVKYELTVVGEMLTVQFYNRQYCARQRRRGSSENEGPLVARHVFSTWPLIAVAVALTRCVAASPARGSNRDTRQRTS